MKGLRGLTTEWHGVTAQSFTEVVLAELTTEWHGVTAQSFAEVVLRGCPPYGGRCNDQHHLCINHRLEAVWNQIVQMIIDRDTGASLLHKARDFSLSAARPAIVGMTRCIKAGISPLVEMTC